MTRNDSLWLRLAVLSALSVLAVIVACPEGAEAQWTCPRPDPDPGCPELSTPYASLPDSISVPTRWGGLNEAPSLADTTLVCEAAGADFFVLWRRHERASECVWIDQGNLTLRSGAIFEMQEFPMIDDPNTSFGVAGEVAIVEECDTSDTASDEMMDLWLNFDEQWQDLGSTIGIMALHTKRLVDEDGDSCARGVVPDIGNPAMPWLAVSDPQDLCDQSDGVCQFNERSLAHEFGHLCDLEHVSTADRLMVTGGETNDTTLTQDELDQCRDYLNDNAATFGFDAPAGADVVADAPVAQAGGQDAAFDAAADTDGPRATDMRKVLVQRSQDGGLTIRALTRGLMEPDSPADYVVAIDIDNNAETGADLREVFDFKEIAIGGVEWVGVVAVDRPPTQCTEIRLPITLASALSVDRLDRSVTTGKAAFVQARGFVEVKHPQVRAFYRTTCMVICDFDDKPGFVHTHVEVPTLQQLTIELPGELVKSQGPLRIQIFARDQRTNRIDALPNTPAVMTFPRVEFPTMRLNPPAVRAGDPVQVRVAGLRPGSSLHTLMGFTEIDTGEVIVDGGGRANYVMKTPATVAVGPHLVTVGADVLTADDILRIVAPGEVFVPPGSKEVLELLLSFEDLLRRQAISLEQFGDLIEAFQRRTSK